MALFFLKQSRTNFPRASSSTNWDRKWLSKQQLVGGQGKDASIVFIQSFTDTNIGTSPDICFQPLLDAILASVIESTNSLRSKNDLPDPGIPETTIPSEEQVKRWSILTIDGVAETAVEKESRKSQH
jgi:hypothetical protein